MLSLQNRKPVLFWKLFNAEVTWTVIALDFWVLDQADFSGMTCLLFLETQTPAVCTGLPRVFFSNETLLTGWNVSMGVSQYSNQVSSQHVSVLLSYQYSDVLYSEAAEMFAELNTVLKKKKKICLLLFNALFQALLENSVTHIPKERIRNLALVFIDVVQQCCSVLFFNIHSYRMYCTVCLLTKFSRVFNSLILSVCFCCLTLSYSSVT